MRLYIIGRVLREHKISGKKNGGVEAYMVYDLHTKEAKLVDLTKINQMVLGGLKIIGLRVQGKSIIPTSSIYNTRHTDELDGTGQPITPAEERKGVLVGARGFKEKRVYRIVNSQGKDREVTYNELCKLARDNKIIGAKLIKNKDDEEVLKLYKECNAQIY